jgi:hypothetical protein
VISAYELIRTEVGRSANVGQAVARIDGVTEAAVVTGPCGVMPREGSTDIHPLGRRAFAKIQRVEGLTRPLTCPVVHL